MSRGTRVRTVGILLAWGMVAAVGPLRVVAGDLSAYPSASESDVGPGPAESAAPAQDASAACEPATPQPWTLPQPCLLQNLGIKMGGWIEQGVTGNNWNPTSNFNGPNATNDRDQYEMNQLWLYFVRPTNTDGCGFDLGGRIDACYGSDWRFGDCYGLESRINDPNNLYGLVLPQFYVEVAYNDLTVKMGHFATATSLEAVPAPANFFYSHAYIMCGYYDPLLVTGLQAEYKLNDEWTAVGGFNRGWELFESPLQALDFLGGLRWASADKRSTLSAMVISGETITATGPQYVTNSMIVYTHQFNDRFTYATQVNAGGSPQGSALIPGHSGTWYGTEQLFTYTINPQWSAGLRYEWIRDADGARVAGVGNVLGTNAGWGGQPGFAGDLSDLTLGLNYRPHPNLTLRPEVRWDWYSGQPNQANQLPFGNYDRVMQFTAAMDLIVTY